MFTLKATSATLLLTSLIVAGSVRAGFADAICDEELSTPDECWWNCKTEDEITICDIIVNPCPDGIDCGFTESEDSGQLTITVPSPVTTGPRVGEYITKYVKDRQARGRVTTRVYRTVSVDSLGETELVIIVTPKPIRPVP